MGACYTASDLFFFMNLPLNEVKKDGKGKIYPVIHSPVHGEYIGKNCSSVPQSVCKLQLFCKPL